MKTTLRKILCVLSILYIISAIAEAAKYVDRIVAVVNDDIITLSELNSALEPYETQIRARSYTPEQERKMLFKVREEILNQLVEQKLTDQQIKKANINISETEIDHAIERIKEARFYTDEELRRALKEQSLSLEELRNRLKDQILRTKLMNREVKSKIVITHEDIVAYYKSHPEVYGGEKKYHLRNIIMRFPAMASTDAKRSVQERMAAILQKLKNGESFETLARQFSESPVASEGGDLGTFELNALALPIQVAIKDLNPTEFTDVLETDQGYQIFYLENIINSPGKPLEEVSGEIREKLFNDIVNKKFRLWLEDLRLRSHIKLIK
jgi:peptidyl-prolyl cis-trans isomerase SurA